LDFATDPSIQDGCCSSHDFTGGYRGFDIAPSTFVIHADESSNPPFGKGQITVGG
jgi:hypothetical protein